MFSTKHKFLKNKIYLFTLKLSNYLHVYNYAIQVNIIQVNKHAGKFQINFNNNKKLTS